MGSDAPSILLPKGLRPARAGLALAVGACVVLLHALVLLGLPFGAGPPLREPGVRPLSVRQIVAPRGQSGVDAAAAPARPLAPAPAPVRRVAAATPAQPGRAEPVAAPAARSSAEPAAESSTDADVGGRPLPTYATQPPPSLRLHYALRRNQAAGSAELRWVLDGARYELALSGTFGDREAFGWTSRGRIDAHGLAPERFAVRRRARELLAANFQRDEAAGGRITFSGPSVELPLVPGVQDRASWLIQLAAIVEATPALGRAGAQVSMLVVGARGDAVVWTFTAAGRVPLEGADGAPVEALHFVREPRRAYDVRADVWLDPARRHLPVRLRLQAWPAGEATELSLTALQMP